MTKTTELAEKYANANCSEYSTDGDWSTESDYAAIEDAYKNGAQDMLEKACEWIKTEVLEDYAGIIWENIVDDFRKAMEE